MSGLEHLSADALRREQERTLAAPRRRYSLLARVLFRGMDLVYGRRRTLSKLKVLELIARVPYQAWEQVACVAMTHTSRAPDFARRIFDRVRESRQQQDNEQWHLLILEDLIAQRGVREGFVKFWLLPQLVAFVCYQIVWLLYVVRPARACLLNAEFEDHAEHEHMEFVRECPELAREPFESVVTADYGSLRIARRPVPSDRVRRARAQGGVPGLDVPAEVRMKVVAIVFALLLVGPPMAPAAPLAHREVLPNGIVLLVAERPAVPIVAVRVSHQAGAVFDPPDHAGLANLTGAVLTRGTARRSGPELDAAIEFVGGRLEAGAGRDGLSESLSILKRDLALGLDLLQEVVLTPAFPDAEVKRKIGEIQAAIQRSEESPETVASRALARLTFPGHPYGTPVEGTKESVGKLTRDDVVQFYRTYVRPDTTVIAVVGAITVDEARREVMTRFGSWPKPAAPAPSPPGPPTSGSPASETIKKELTQATILLGRQAVNQRNPDYFPLTVASYVLGGGSASRLYSRVREEGGLAYAVYSYLAPGRYGASFIGSAQTRVAEVAKVGEILREELARMTRERVTDRELSLAKAYLIGSFPLRLDTSAKVADFLIAVEELGLGLDYADRYRERIARVTADDVLRVAGQYFPPQTFNRVVVGPAP